MRRRLLAVLLVLALSAAAAAIATAQVTTATIYGSITDQAGAPIVGATVTATMEATATSVATTSNELGEFTFTFLPVGRYRLTISAQGFKEQSQPGIELVAGQRQRLTYTLEIGSVSEKVIVTAEAPIIQAVSPEQQETHSTLEVKELPLSRRDWTNILIVGTGTNVRGTGVVLNGIGAGAFNFTVDGTEASSSSEDSSLTLFGNFNFIKAVSLEAIAEVNVNKGIMSAEFADTISGNIGLITKSGTNEYHGSLFWNYQGRVLNARNAFLTTRPPEVFNQFGASAGGPIIKNKLFFFGVYEGGHLVAAAGTHLLSREEGAAAIGNIYVRRDRRGRGIGRIVTAGVMRELAGVETVGLNVRADNAATIQLYESLGFVEHCLFYEAMATAAR